MSLALAEVHALASMLASDFAASRRRRPDFDEDLSLIEEVAGVSCDTAEGTCKKVVIVGKQWVIKWSSPTGRIGNSDENELEFLAGLEEHKPELVRFFAKTHAVAEGWTIQEYVRIDQDEYADIANEVDDITYRAGVGDVFWRNVGFRPDGSWIIFDFDV